MARFDQFSSEEEAIKAMIHDGLNGYEERLMKLFIQLGPEALRKLINVPNDFVWCSVFDHLVFDLNVLKRCVEKFFPFFKDYVLKNGPLALREVFGIQDSRYDQVFEKLMDDLVIGKGLLFEHVYAHTREYLQALKKGRGADIRVQLGLQAQKYDQIWKEIVNFLLDAFTREKLKDKQKDQTQSFLNLWRSRLSG
jgi:hypothetical protein